MNHDKRELRSVGFKRVEKHASLENSQLFKYALRHIGLMHQIARSMRLWAMCCAFVLLLIHGFTTTTPAAPLNFPGVSWEEIPESELGSTCRNDLKTARDYVRTLDTTALMAVQDGRVLLSEGPVQTVSIVFSVRKSVLSMLYGKYVASGTINLDHTLADLGIDDVGGLLPTEQQATLRDCSPHARVSTMRPPTVAMMQLPHRRADRKRQAGTFFITIGTSTRPAPLSSA
jgi:hypothetical protein